MSKFINLSEDIAIATENTRSPYAWDAQHEALEWLDSHPDQVPGRTITESEFQKALHSPHSFRSIVKGFGITVIPDPEPTNAELLEQLHDQYRMFPAQHLPGNGSLADYLDHKGVRAPDHG